MFSTRRRLAFSTISAACVGAARELATDDARSLRYFNPPQRSSWPRSRSSSNTETMSGSVPCRCSASTAAQIRPRRSSKKALAVRPVGSTRGTTVASMSAAPTSDCSASGAHVVEPMGTTTTSRAGWSRFAITALILARAGSFEARQPRSPPAQRRPPSGHKGTGRPVE